MDKRATVIQRVSVMKRKAADAGATSAESESLLAKVAKLMDEYLISEHELHEQEQEQIRVYDRPIAIDNDHYRVMLVTLGDLLGVTVAFSADRKFIIVSARKTVAIVFGEMSDHLTLEIVKKAKIMPVSGLDNFISGCCITVTNRLDAQRRTTLNSRLPVALEKSATEKVLMDTIHVQMFEEVKKPEVTMSTILGMMSGESVEINKKV